MPIARFLSGIFLLTSLSACDHMGHHSALSSQEISDIDQQLLTSSNKIQQAQLSLYEAGALQAQPLQLSHLIVTDENLINVEWVGDAESLLQELASNSEREFNTQGQSLELPVTVTLTETSFPEVMQFVSMQLNGRADIDWDANNITLHYQ